MKVKIRLIFRKMCERSQQSKQSRTQEQHFRSSSSMKSSKSSPRKRKYFRGDWILLRYFYLGYLTFWVMNYRLNEAKGMFMWKKGTEFVYVPALIFGLRFRGVDQKVFTV